MCGFVGVLLKEKALQFSTDHLEDIKESSNLINHRGPDEEGFFNDSSIALSFKRLSIIDHAGGQQPWLFGDDRYRMVFNGEIYNFKQLRSQLEEKGHAFYTTSDTEVIGAMFLEKGVEAFTELRGMFAIIIWDRQEKALYGARDAFGIKPFYYSESDSELIMASEKKSITYLTQRKKVHEVALQYYMSFQYVPDPMSLTEGVQRLEPGHYFVKKWNKPIRKQRYFHATFEPVKGNEQQIIRCVRDVMLDSVEKHMQSDAPLGAFLSGGIDSTFIVGLAKEVDPHIKTFSVGFEVDGYSEISVAEKSAEVMGVQNFTRNISAEDYVNALPKIMWHMDDPLADPASIPLYFVAQEAGKQVKVVLSGEGADELFGGYTIYREPTSLKFFEYMPNMLLRLLNKLAAIFPEGMKGKSFLERGTTPLQQRYIGNAKMFEEKEKAQLLQHYDKDAKYLNWTSNLYKNVQSCHKVHQMQYIDIHTWLPGDILLKADKMTMAHSLELRVPFLDKEVFEVARKLEVESNFTSGTTKAILRKAAEGIVPEHVINRRKLGFPVPIKSWLRNELYSWAENLINQSETNYVIDKQIARELLASHAIGKRDYSRKLWTILMFMQWHQIYVEQEYDVSPFNQVKQRARVTS
ncbi:asparagine synthase (glutamine-hydrolyzing) [Oceanobacillus manasiensis]|uniref:asparagine synthase (glutamine-hydrolyzing) n=1 Tax=Oceanobacillus manasiensis TaxID=586413 RepID=UPI0005AAF2C7|nr:asparagine synthase (glutamine-hydrolyzing) [Oceanobacillus manasiensis]